MGLIFYVIDTETTGLKLDYHEMNQISIIRASDKSQITEDIKVKFPNNANFQALEIQNKTKTDLKKGLPLQTVVEKIDEWIKSDGEKQAARCMIAHNAAFDKKFCEAAWKECGKVFPADLWLCTIQLAKLYVKKYCMAEKIAQAQGETKPKFALNKFCEAVGITPKVGAHNAEVDSMNTLDLFNYLIKAKTEYVSLIKRSSTNDKTTTSDDSDD